MIKKFKYFILFISTLTPFSLIGYGQKRINKTTNYFNYISSSQEVITPTGWYFLPDLERWSGYYGAICAEYEKNHNTPKKLTSEELSYFEDRGIYSLQIKKVNFSDKNYYLMFHTYWTGEWEYPAIYVGWNYFKNCRIYIFEEEEFEKFLTPKIGINKIKIKTWTYGDDNYTQSLNSTFRSLNLHSENKKDDNFNIKRTEEFFYIKLEDDGQTLRFHLPTSKILWDEVKDNDGKKIERVPVDDDICIVYENQYYSHDCIDFTNSYFELTPLQYNKLKTFKTDISEKNSSK